MLYSIYHTWLPATPRLHTHDKAWQREWRREGSRSHKPRGYRSTRIWERGVEDRAKRRTCQNSNGPVPWYISTDGKAASLFGCTHNEVRDFPSCRLRRNIPPGSIAASGHDARPRWVPLRSIVVPGYPGGRGGHRAKALLTPPPCRRRAPHLDEAYIP